MTRRQMTRRQMTRRQMTRRQMTRRQMTRRQMTRAVATTVSARVEARCRQMDGPRTSVQRSREQLRSGGSVGGCPALALLFDHALVHQEREHLTHRCR
jgi:hypothetical protein